MELGVFLLLDKKNAAESQSKVRYLLNKMTSWIFALVFLLNLQELLSLRHETSTSLRYFLPCLANITFRIDERTDFLLLSEELASPTVPSDEIVRIVRRPVVIQQDAQFSGYFGFFMLFPTEEKSYESLFKIIHLSVYNK